MLYEIMTFAFYVIVLVGTVYMVSKVFRAGYQAGYHAAKGEPIPVPTKSIKQPKPLPETPEQRKARIIQENIENYGTRKPQQEVK